LVNPLYPAVGSQICLKSKFVCGWPLGLPAATHKACSRRELGNLCGSRGQR